MEAILIVLIFVLVFLFLKNNQNKINQSVARRYFEETEFDFKSTINKYSFLISNLVKHIDHFNDGTPANSLIISQTFLLKSTIRPIS